MTDEKNEKFPPRPGGMVDSFRKSAAEAEEAVKDVTEIVTGDGQGYEAIRVQEDPLEVFSGQTLNLGAGKSRMLLPADRKRVRAVVWVNTSGGTIVICKTRSDADNSNGATLAQGTPPVELRTCAEVFIGNTGASTVSVSLVSEMHQP